MWRWSTFLRVVLWLLVLIAIISVASKNVAAGLTFYLSLVVAAVVGIGGPIWLYREYRRIEREVRHLHN